MLENDKKSVLVIVDRNICYGTLYSFGKEFIRALRTLGQEVIEFNVEGKTSDDYIKLIDKEYSAVIGFQTVLFSLELTTGGYFGDLFKCPKYNFIFDHPLQGKKFLMLPIKEYYVLTIDKSYAEYINTYYENIREAYFFTPGGIRLDCSIPVKDRKYDVVYMGTYYNYRDGLKNIYNMDKKDRKVALRLLNYMKHNPYEDVHNAFVHILENMQCVLNGDEFRNELVKMSDVLNVIINYYKEKVIRALLDSGIEINVFSKGWEDSSFKEYENLIIHEEKPYVEGVREIADSKISLNIMSWHKNGITERVIDSMFNRALCVTDATYYMKNNFVDNENIVLFDFTKLGELAEKIKDLLKIENIDKVKSIADAGYEVVAKQHTWDDKARLFMEINEKNGGMRMNYQSISQEYINQIENTYNERFMEQEEKELREGHKKYDNKIKAYVQILDTIIKEKNVELLQKFVMIFNSQVEEKMFEYSEDMLYMYRFLEMYIEEWNDRQTSELINIVENYDEYVKMMIDIRFFVWRIEYLDEEINSFKAYIEEKKLSIYILCKAIMISYADKEKGMKLLQRLAEGHEDWLTYLQKKVAA